MNSCALGIRCAFGYRFFQCCLEHNSFGVGGFGIRVPTVVVVADVVAAVEVPPGVVNTAGMPNQVVVRYDDIFVQELARFVVEASLFRLLAWKVYNKNTCRYRMRQAEVVTHGKY